MATMSVYDSSTPWTALGRNPNTNAEFLDFVDTGTLPLLGTRPMYTTNGYWADNKAVGYDITDYEYISMIIEYDTLTITEDATYEFDIDSDDFGELWIDDTLVAWEVVNTCTTIPIILTAGAHTCVFKFQNGTGLYSFQLRWRKQGDVTYGILHNSSVGLPDAYLGHNVAIPIDVNTFTDYPHKLTIKTQLDGVAVPRRVEIRNRATGEYIASKLTDVGGVAEFRRLPQQAIDEPHIITCFDDRTEGFLNALVYDRVFQVTDQGFPPEN